jgi:predicted DNA-binding protein
MVYPEVMPNLEKPIRQSVSLPPRVARRLKALARTKKTSTNRVVVDLIEAGLEAQAREKKRFFDLADRLSRSSDPDEQERLKDDLARMTFGE